MTMKKLLLVFLSFHLFYYCLCQTGRLSEQTGSVKNTSTLSHGVAFELTNAYAEITAYNPTTVRVRVAKQKFSRDFSFAIDNLISDYNFKTVSTDGNKKILMTDSLKVVVNTQPFRISFYNLRDEFLSGDDESLGISWWGNQVDCYRKLNTDEKFIGLGEKTGGINRRGQFYRNWNSDIPGYALNQDPLYATIPFFIGIHGHICYGTFFDNTHQSYFNFGGGADEELYHFGADDGEMNYYFFGGSSVAQILKDYTALTGRTPMPPLWSLGYQQCRWGYANENELLNIAKTLRDKKLPSDVVYMDITYMDRYKVFTWDPVNFPHPKEMVDQLKKMNFDLVTIIDPGIKIEKGYKAYDEGVAQNHFAKYPDGKLYVGHVWPGRCHFPDFTKPATRKWWGNNFKTSHVDIGVKGFWNDMNEPAAWGREFPNLIEFGDASNKTTLYTVKNAYGLLMARSTYEGTKALMNGQRPFVLTRASYSGIQKFSAEWTGDNVASDEHMLLGQRLLNSMAVSGIPYVGMDIGGFNGDVSPELYVRWMNLGIYSPLMRQHSTIDSRYHEPWQFGEANTRFLRSLLEQRYKLLPYLYSSFYQAHLSGMPINRMLPVEYTFDDHVYNDKYGNEFLFGDNILVCPVDSKTLATEVYLPGNATKWYRVSSGKVYDGGQVQFVSSPLDDLPVFVKESGIVPMQGVVQNTKEKGDGILYVHVWKGNNSNSFVYYEDDGTTYDYEKSEFYKRIISYLPASGQIIFDAKEGSYSSKFDKVKLVLHNFERIASATINGSPASVQQQDEISTVDFSNSNNKITVELK
jgi:alpha-glucosidase